MAHFDKVVAELDPEYLSQVTHITKMSPVTEEFNALEDRLVRIFSPSQEAKLQELFSGLELGDQLLSQLLPTLRIKGVTRVSQAFLK